MAFIDRSEVLFNIPQEGDKNPCVAIYLNDNTLEGQFENRQILRRYADQSWVLSVNVGFTVFNIPLQTQQAEAILKYDAGHYFKCAVVDQQKF